MVNNKHFIIYKQEDFHIYVQQVGHIIQKGRQPASTCPFLITL